jgi:uncharacterized RDD family membrane protein YckC
MDPMPAPNGQLDTTIQVVTPENIAFRYQAAGPFRRLPAYLIDMGICALIVLFASLVLELSFESAGWEGIATGLKLLIGFLLYWFYGGLFECFWNGQTPGKRWTRLRVLSVEGQPINGLQAVLRNILRFLDVQPLGLCQVGLLTMMLNDRYQRLGDLACGTMVVVEERRRSPGVVRIHEAEALRLAGLIRPDFQASHSLARALAAYVQRRGAFAPARRQEIARHLGRPLAEKLELPQPLDYDMLLCGLYHRTFIADRGEEPVVPLAAPETDAEIPFALLERR